MAKAKKAAKSTKKPTAKAKTAAKAAKKPAVKAKKPAVKAKKPAVKRVAPPELSAKERQKLLKPRTDYGDVIEKVARAWEADPSLKVPGLTRAKLLSQWRAAKRAGEREDALRAKMEAKLRPLADARRLADDSAYRSLLDVHATVKLFTRTRPSVGEAYAFLAEHLTSARPEVEPEGEPTPVPA
ncbi:MAG: hypothetical protein JWM10_4444 [Myxococcaceae bacterium]|nr:hypothetical protein [Myxococcaceae bacterium]